MSLPNPRARARRSTATHLPRKRQSVAFSRNRIYRFGMRTALLTLCFVVTVAGTAQARLGETADQLVQRYGQPLSEKDQKGEGRQDRAGRCHFREGRISVNVTVVDGLNRWPSRSRKSTASRSRRTEVRTLLNANAQGHEWEAPEEAKGGKLWTRDDSMRPRFSARTEAC